MCRFRLYGTFLKRWELVFKCDYLWCLTVLVAVRGWEGKVQKSSNKIPNRKFPKVTKVTCKYPKSDRKKWPEWPKVTFSEKKWRKVTSCPKVTFMFPKVIEQRWPKVISCPKVTCECPNVTRLAQKWPDVSKSDPKCPKVTQRAQKWPEVWPKVTPCAEG